jgi:hypothetical protein
LKSKRKRKPTQRILQYCLEAEASIGPKKKVFVGVGVVVVGVYSTHYSLGNLSQTTVVVN